MRTIIVGDVHGCSIELAALLEQVGFANGDRLVFVGDVIARGPYPLEVLDIVRQTGATLVRGNHEQKLLDWHGARQQWIRREAAAKPPISRMHRNLARSLRPIDWTLLETSKIWLDLPDHEVRVVHAGIDPDVTFDHQKSSTVMHIRTVPVPDGRGKRQVLWGSRYSGPPHIIFGHNAVRGLQLHGWATGLDTGCVYGGRLTALVLNPAQKVPRGIQARRALLFSEAARRVWYVPEQGTPPGATSAA